MGKELFGLGALAIVGLLLFNSFDPVRVEQRAQRASYEAAQQRLDLDQRSFDLDRYKVKADATLAGEIATDYALRLGVFLGGVLILGVALDAYRQRRRPMVRADQHGLFPVARSTIVDGEIVDLVRDVALEVVRAQQLRAVHQPGQSPAAFTYAPTWSSRNDGATGAAQNLGTPATPPTFASLLDQGVIGPGRPLLLGYGPEGPLTGGWGTLYSTAVAGAPGAGKSTTIRFLAAQSALAGARFCIVDPHGESGDESLAGTLAPLTSAFLCDPAISERECVRSVRMVAAELDARLRDPKRPRRPLILALDELTRLMGRSTIAGPLGELLEAISQEGRKVGVFALLAGQVWTAERSGGTPLRDTLASAYVHRCRRNQARLLLPSDEAAKAERLPTGRALLYAADGTVVLVTIPDTTRHDVSRAAALLASPAQDTPGPGYQDGYHPGYHAATSGLPQTAPGGTAGQATTASQSHGSQNAEACKAAELFLSGLDPAQLTLELRGVRSSEGRRYQEALKEVLDLVRAGLQS